MTSGQTDRLLGLVGNAAIKVPCKAASTANLTLSGEQTIDGIACVTDDRMLVKNQTTGADNGIYVVDTGTWNRAKDCDGTYDLLQNSLVAVAQGSTNGGTVFKLTTANPITIGTSTLTWVSMGLLSTPIAVASGGTGGTTKTAALSNLGVIQVTAEAGTNTITGTIDALVTAYITDQLFILNPFGTNTGATTFNPTPSGGAALGAKNVFFGGAACVGGELVAGVPVLLQYDGTQLNIIGTPATITPKVPVTKNATLAASAAGNALTISLKGWDGTDPSAANPVKIPFRADPITSGVVADLTITAALSVTVSSGSTLGTKSTVPIKIWVVIFNDNGTPRLGVIHNCVYGTQYVDQGGSSVNCYPILQISRKLQDTSYIASSTAEGGAGGADSADVIYTTTAVTTEPFCILGYVEYGGSGFTPGSWSTPDAIVNYMPGMKLPGDVIQQRTYVTGTVSTGTTVMVLDDTIPNTSVPEGFAIFAGSVETLQSNANALDVEMVGHYAVSAAGTMIQVIVLGLPNTGAGITVAASCDRFTSTGVVQQVRTSVVTTANKAAVTGGVNGYAGNSAAATVTVNGAAGAQLMGGMMNSYLRWKEICT